MFELPTPPSSCSRTRHGRRGARPYDQPQLCRGSWSSPIIFILLLPQNWIGEVSWGPGLLGCQPWAATLTWGRWGARCHDAHCGRMPGALVEAGASPRHRRVERQLLSVWASLTETHCCCVKGCVCESVRARERGRETKTYFFSLMWF